MKKFCFFLAMICALSLLTACAGQPIETTVTPEQTTAVTTETTVDTTTETPVIPPVVDPWQTAVYSKEPWWENTVAITNSLKNASAGSLVIANNILTQENDSLLVVEAYVNGDKVNTIKDQYEFFSSFGFEMFTNENFAYSHRGLGIPLLLASKEQLLSISFPKDYKVGFTLAFASKAFYEDPHTSFYQILQDYKEDKEYFIELTLKNPSGYFYVSPEEARTLWPIVYEKYPILPRLSWHDDSKTYRSVSVTGKQLHALFISDGFFDDFKIAFDFPFTTCV